MQNQTIGKRLAMGFGGATVVILLLAILSASRMADASKAFSQVTDQHLPEMSLATAFNRSILNARIHFAYYLAVRKDGEKELGEQFLEQAKQLMPQLKRQVVSSPELAGLAANTAMLEQDLQAYESKFHEVMNSGAAVGSDTGKAWTRLGNRMADTSSALTRDCSELAAGKSRQQASQMSQGLKIVVSGSIISILAGVLTSILVVRGIRRQLRHAVAGLREAARNIAEASHQLADSATTLAQGASKQAASVEETSASCEEISSMARRSSGHAKAMVELVTSSQDATASGTSELERMLEAMKDAVDASGKVKRVIQVIDEIAFRTNILALNAAVEAARAGEAGAGFAVVADEVRSLAQRSAEAARQTAELVENSVTSTNASRAHLDSVTGAMGTIHKGATETKTIADEVNAGSLEQTRGIEQISRTLTQVDSITQQVAAAAEQSASAATELSSQVSSMIHVADELNALVG